MKFVDIGGGGLFCITMARPGRPVSLGYKKMVKKLYVMEFCCCESELSTGGAVDE